MAGNPPVSALAASKTPQGQLKKHTLTRHIRFDCERQLLLDIGRNDPRWLADTRNLAQSPAQPQSSQVLFDLGHAFEQRIYRMLDHRQLYTQAARDPHGRVDTRKVSPTMWRALAADLLASDFDETFLLEHEFDAPHNLLKRWLGVSEEDELPILDPQQQLRPDIIVLSKPARTIGRRALTASGKVVLLHEQDERIEVRFVDVKYTNRESVGKKHYIELLYYTHAFALYLHEHGLDGLFYVPLAGHGILPQLDATSTHVFDIADFDALVEPMIWRDHAHLLTSIEGELSKLWSLAPVEIGDVQANLQPGCVLCPYLGECRKLAGYDPDRRANPGASVDLLAYTSIAVAEQLKPHDIKTVEDLSTADIPDPVTPTPLASERPMLALKAKSLATGMSAWASEESDGTQRHMSMAIPQFTDSVVTFAAENDPTNDRVFVYALAADIRIKDGKSEDGQRMLRPYAELHDRLWEALGRQLNERNAPTANAELARIYISDELDQMVADSAGIDLDQLKDRRELRFKRLVKLLKSLANDGDVSIDTSKQYQEHAWIRLEVGDLNNGKEDLDEQKMARQLVLHAVKVIEAIVLYEELTCGIGSYTDDKTGELKTYVACPTSGLFYWSYDQLEHIRELLERHLVYMLTSSDVYDEFRQLMELVTPAESGIQHHYRSRKIFDLRQFVETTVGLPQIINYTWHETAHEVLPNTPVFNRNYWSSHYNYMYFGMWHSALDGGSFGDRRALIEQARRKAKVIGQLTRTFQGRARKERVLSVSSYAMRTRNILEKDHSHDHFHFIARAWTAYNKLDATLQEQVAVDQRLTFPLKSIGKLVAAHVTNLSWEEQGSDLSLEFTLEGLSSNVKFKAGSYVFFIHETRRDEKPSSHGQDTIIIDAMEWDASREAYVVSARAKAHSAKTERYMATIARLPDLSPRGWYLYASTLDIWQSRLERAIAERHLEDSWLGDRRAYLMGLMPADEQLLPPRENRFDVAECAMYAPELLPATPVEDDFEILTPSHPPLDDSKKEAIAMVFHNPMSCILGPPGTGKSQTIAALIDEYLCRHPEGPVKILVSASSYEPMSVVLDKLQSHRDAAGNPTRAASIEKVWLRATSREGLDREDVRDFCLDTGRKRMYLDGEQIKRGKKSRLYEGEKWRMDDELPDRFILFGVPFQLSQLLRRKDGLGEYLHIEHFAFDLVIVDEASQMPVDQATTLLPLIRRGCVETASLPVLDDQAPLTDAAMVEAMRAERVVGEDGNVLSAEDLTRIILVGDHNQLPPVQQIEPPEKLRAILESAFAYFQQHLGVPSTQLQTNYRSREEVVAYTNSLDLYEHPVIPFFADHPGIEPLPSPPDPCPTWLESLLEDECVVSALVHESQFDTAVSDLEASLVADVVCTFYRQLSPQTPEEELAFWAEELGIVSPHNAHGRLITRQIYARMLGDDAAYPNSLLDGSELMRALSETIYSVEKFQGSARSFIIASMGISATDQIRAEETFIYDLNRLNVLTSRAVKKMMLVASHNLLEYVPHTRRMIGPAARLRDYAYHYCNTGEGFDYKRQTITRRWHDPTVELEHRHSGPIQLPKELLEEGKRRQQQKETQVAYDEAAIDAMLEGLPPEARAMLLAKLQQPK